MCRFSIVLLIILTSCSSESVESNLNPTTSNKLLSSITSTFSDYFFEREYTYDTNDNLLTVSVEQLAGYTSIVGLEYENNLPTKQFPIYQQTFSPYYQITYEGNLISELNYIEPSTNTIISKWIYLYDNDILIECSLLADNNSDGTLTEMGSLTIEYQNENVSKITDNLTNTYILYEYDDKVNPLHNINHFDLIQQISVKDLNIGTAISRHNMTSMSFYYSDGTLYNQHIWVYTYDSDNFPITAVQTSDLGDAPIYHQFHYE